MDNHLTIRLPKRLVKATLVLALVAAVISPIAVSASHVFDDVPDSNVFHEDIAWLANAGVTLGCNPPSNTNYCPNSNVSRAQMAAFLRRLAENQVVDAATALTAGSAATADNAVLLGGSAPNLYRTVVRGSSCYGTSCVDVPSITNQRIMQVTITAPTAGVLQLHSTVDHEFTAPGNDYATSWMTLNGNAGSFGGCEGSFLGVPIGDHKVIGSERFMWVDTNNIHESTAAAPAVSVPAGTHVVRLCAFSNVSIETWSATLSAVWSAEGSGTTLASTTGSIEISPELTARLEAAVNE